MRTHGPLDARRYGARLLAAAVALTAFVPKAAAAGHEEPEKVQAVVKDSKQWIFTVAAFDTSELPASQRLIGELSAERLKRAIQDVGIRKRSPEELEAYADHADAEARSAAGASLAEKRKVRADLLYHGHPGWKYRKELAKADAAVEEAEEKLREAERLRSRVETDAKITLSKANAESAFPPAPRENELSIFCVENDLDAVLIGSVEPFYGRMRLRTRLYSRFLRAVMYEDEVVFSSEDREAALAELEGRLKAAVGGEKPAALSVVADPGDADIVVDGKLVGRGSAGPIERRPVPTTIGVSSPSYEPAETTVELSSEEHSKVSIRLKPLKTAELAVEAVGTAELQDVAVRLGALYSGVAPVTLSFPADEMAYVAVETADGLGASAAVSGGGRLVLDLKPLPGPDAKPVETARRRFYGAFGRFSIALPIAFFTSGLALVYENAAIWSDDPDMEEKGESMRSVANGAVTAAVCFFLESAVRFGLYLHAANERATPLVRPTPKADG